MNTAPCFYCGDETTGIHKVGKEYVWSHVNCQIHEHIMNCNKSAHYKQSYGVSQGVVVKSEDFAVILDKKRKN